MVKLLDDLGTILDSLEDGAYEKLGTVNNRLVPPVIKVILRMKKDYKLLVRNVDRLLTTKDTFGAVED